jgi:hypothetical protein
VRRGRERSEDEWAVARDEGKVEVWRVEVGGSNHVAEPNTVAARGGN